MLVPCMLSGLASVMLVSCAFEKGYYYDLARPRKEDQWPIAVGGPTEGVSYKDLYVLSVEASGSAPKGYYFRRFWPDGRCTHRYILQEQYPTPSDGDHIEMLLLGRYTASNGVVRTAFYSDIDNQFLEEEGMITKTGIQFRERRESPFGTFLTKLGVPPDRVDVSFYEKTDFPAGAMKLQKPNW